MTFSKDLKDKILPNVPLNVPPVGKKKQFSISFYTGGLSMEDWPNAPKKNQEEALKKSWYIRWRFRNPSTGKLERQSNIKAGLNRFTSKSDRIEFMRTYKKGMEDAFEEGYNPYTYKDPEPQPKTTITTARKAILHALSNKKETVSKSTYLDYKSHIKAFLEYLKAIGKDNGAISLVDRVDVSTHLDNVLRTSSARNRNNVRASLSSIFSELRDKFIINSNFIDTDIKKLKVNSKTDRRFTFSQMRIISDHLKNNDPHLLLYIKIVAYNFLRPIEVNRLTVGDIDLESQTMYFDQKTKSGKTKYIPNLYIDEFRELLKDNPTKDCHLFTPNNTPEIWQTQDRDKRNYFTRRFKKTKEALGIDGNYGIYSFRHTYITNTYLVLRKKGMAENEAIQYLMRITGHESEAIMKYIHVNDADRPEDWSDLLDFKL